MTRSAAVRTPAVRRAATGSRTASAAPTGTASRTAAAAPRPAASRTAAAARTGTASRTATATASRAARLPELRLVSTGTAVRARRRARIGLLSRRGPFVLLVVALLALTTVGLLVLNTAIAVDSLKASQMRADNAARVETVQRLERQVVSARTPVEVARAAVAAGLVRSGVAGYLVLGPGGSTTMRGTPEPAPAPEPAPVPGAAPAPAPAAAPPGGN